jgi:hemerythrin
MAMEWNESFVLGIDEIDQQHKMIVERFRELSDAVQDAREEEVLAEMTKFLTEYAQFHFVTEERYMKQYAYPDIAEQLAEHAQFSRDAVELQSKLSGGADSHKLAVEMTGKMLRWVVQHVRNHDRKMVLYIKEKMALTA